MYPNPDYLIEYPLRETFEGDELNEVVLVGGLQCTVELCQQRVTTSLQDVHQSLSSLILVTFRLSAHTHRNTYIIMTSWCDVTKYDLMYVLVGYMQSSYYSNASDSC